jgi:hypothetical protein
MATARVIHNNEENNPNPQPIVISSSGATPKACIILNGQPVAFSSSGPTVNITFEPDAFPPYPGFVVFNNITGVSPTNPVTASPQTTNRTVNYNIDGSNVFPYAIQVGAGPLYVSVVAGAPVQDPVVIPLNGSIEMIGDRNYSVDWFTSNGDPFTPTLTNVYTAGNPLTTPHTNNRPVADYGYKLAPDFAGNPTGGTVKVKGT